MRNLIIRASSPTAGPTYAEIRRINNDLSDPRDTRNRLGLSADQEAAYSRAYRLVKEGQDAEAEAVLKAVFEQVKVEYP